MSCFRWYSGKSTANILRKEIQELEDLLKGRKYKVMSNYHNILQNQCGLLLYNLTYYVRSFANICLHNNYISMFFLNVFNIKELQLPMKTNHNNPCPYAWNRQEFIVGNCIRDINKYESGVLATSWWYIWMGWESLGECICLSHS